MAAATGVSPARSVTISHWPVSASAGAARRIKRASPSFWISAVPRRPFQPLASSARKFLDRGGDFFRRARDVETDSALLGETMALAAQLLQFLGPQRIPQQFIGIARGVEAGAGMGLQQRWAHAALVQHLRESFHRCAIQRDIAQDQRMGAGFPRVLHQLRDGLVRAVAIEQRRAQRAVGIGADQSGQGNLAGSPSAKSPASGRSAAPCRLASCVSLHAASANAPVRPRDEAFTANSQSGR